MRIIHLLTALIFLFPVMRLSADIPKADRIEVREGLFAVKGDSVEVRLSFLRQNAKVAAPSYAVLIPIINAAERYHLLPPIRINGATSQKAYERLLALRNNDEAKDLLVINAVDNVPQYNYVARVLFEPWMADAGLLIREEQCHCSAPDVPLSYVLSQLKPVRIKQDSLPLPDSLSDRPDKQPAELPAAHKDSIRNNIAARAARFKQPIVLHFPVSKSEIQLLWSTNHAGIDQLYAMLDTLDNNPYIEIRRIKIAGYSSPDGDLQENERLSFQRALSLQQHLKIMYCYPDSLFTVEGKGEDWEGLASGLEKSSMPYKEEVLHIIRTAGITGGREKRLLELHHGIPYKYLLQDYFPDLRRLEIFVEYNILPIN